MQLEKSNEMSIGAWIKSKEEKEIFIATNDKQLQYFNSNQDMNSLRDTMVQWIYTLGLTDKVKTEDVIAVTKYTRELFPQITVKSIQLAIKYSLQNKLNVDIECYGNFSPLYISRIINAYLEYSNETLKQVEWQKKTYFLQNKEEEEQETYEERLVRARNWIKYYLNYLKNNKRYIGDYNNNAWELFTKLGKLQPQNINLEEAERWADERIKTESMTTQANVFAKLTKERREEEYAKYRKIYGQYFVMKKIILEIENIDSFVDSIEDDLILKKENNTTIN